jgi:soluble lytic murein transglycosylase-like protein
MIVIAAALTCAVANADSGKFSASDVPAARLRRAGKVVISNDSHSINAYHFFGNIRESLFSLRARRVPLVTRSYGAVLFNSNAPVQAPAYLANVIADAARTHGVDPRLVAAVAARESAWNVNAVSRTGACGLMQLMPATAKYLGVANIFDTRDNIHGGTRYLRTLLDTFNGDLDLTLAAYNAGPGAVHKFGGVPPFRETQDYVKRVRATYEASLK